jgi:Transposase, Mutator family
MTGSPLSPWFWLKPGANCCAIPAHAGSRVAGTDCLMAPAKGGSVRQVQQRPVKADGHGMRVIGQSPDPLARMHTMTKRQGRSGTIDIKAVLAEDDEFLRALVRMALQEVLEAEMTEALGAEKGERGFVTATLSSTH